MKWKMILNVHSYIDKWNEAVEAHYLMLKFNETWYNYK